MYIYNIYIIIVKLYFLLYFMFADTEVGHTGQIGGLKKISADTYIFSMK